MFHINDFIKDKELHFSENSYFITNIPTLAWPINWGAFQIVAGWWGHQPGQTAVVGVLTDHSDKRKRQLYITPWNLRDT